MNSYKIGDLIVYKDFYIKNLLKIDMIIDDKVVGYRGAKRDFMGFDGCADIKDVRLASKSEIKNGCRV